MKAIFSLSLLLICYASFALESGTSIYVYTDSALDGGLKNIKSEFKKTLSENKIKWKHKSNKSASILALSENIEKDLLKAKADLYILALGLHDVWDFKKKQAKEADSGHLSNALQAIITTLKKQEKHVTICTPPVCYEGTNADFNKQHKLVSFLIKEVATASEIDCIAVGEGFSKALKSTTPAEKGKGILTKDGVKLNDKGENIVKRLLSSQLGLAHASIGRPLQKGDRGLVATPYARQTAMRDLKREMQAFYEPSMGVTYPKMVDMDFLNRALHSGEAGQLLINQKATFYFLLPQIEIQDDKEYAQITDGSYAAKFTESIKALQAAHDCHIFILTPLLTNEATVKNDLVIDGPTFKRCAAWAEAVRGVAKANGLPIVDLYQACLDYIAEHGTDGVRFAGERFDRGKGVIVYGGIDKKSKHGMPIVLNEISKAINYKRQAQ